jgi:drug/metabolite transporter (DMT)-like permease
MTVPYAGELAATGTVFCWTASSLFFEAAGKRIGSLNVNLIRLGIAFVLFCVTLSLTRGSPVPFDFPMRAWIWLAISGLVGFTLGDMCLFRAFVDVGPRISMLVMSLVPAITAMIGTVFLHEHYGVWQWLGIGVTMAGVGWVIMERRQPGSNGRRLISRRVTVAGLLLALGGTVGQAVGLVTGKYGMGTLDPFAATQIRVIAGALGFSLLFALLGRWPGVWRSLGNRRAMALTSGGAFAGPFLGVSLLMLSLHFTSTGITSTIVAMVPLVLIPAAMLIDRERVSMRAVCGTIVAIVGVILLVSTGSHEAVLTK